MGEERFLSFYVDRKPGISSAKQNVRAAELLRMFGTKEQANGQTGQTLRGRNPVNPSLPLTTRLPDRSEGSIGVNVCRRMLSVFRFTLAPWVSCHVRKMDGPALRAGKDFSRCRPTVFRKVSSSRLAPESLLEITAPEVFNRGPVGRFQPPCPIMIRLPAFKLFNSVGILLPLRHLAYWPGRRQTANHVGI
jgi:hypothetical protein